MKIIATFEESRPVKVERFQGDLKMGERKAEYLDFIESLAETLPVSSLLSTLISQESELKMYLDNITNDDFGMFEQFFNVLCSDLNTGAFEDLPYWPVIRDKLTLHHSTLDLSSPSGIALLNKTINTLRQQTDDKDEQLFQLYQTLLARLSRTQKEKLQMQLAKTVKNELTHESEEEIKKMVEFILPTFEPHVIAEMYEKSKKYSEPNSNVMISSVGIPKNCVWMQQHANTTKYVIEIPKSQFRVKFQDVPFDNVGHPRMLFIFTVANDGNNITEMRLVCVKENADITLDTPIYRYPYSNVFPSGIVCWGAYRDLNMPLHQVANTFLSTSNNSHLGANTLDLYKVYENMPFDDSTLKLFEEGITLKMFL